MPNRDRVTILKVPAGGDAHFASAAVKDLKSNPRRDGDEGSLWLYWPTGSEECYSLDALEKLKEASVKLVSKPSPPHEVERLLDKATTRGVEFFSIGRSGVIQELSDLVFVQGSYGRAEPKHPRRSVVFSVARPDRNVSIGDLWAGFRKALKVAGAKDSGSDHRESSAHAALRLRDEFLARGWLTSAEVGRANGSESATNPAQWASDRRDAGALLGAWSSRDRTYVHPEFQFDFHGILNPRVRDLLAALATHAELTAETDKTGWRRVFWLYGETMGLADEEGRPRSAAALFADEPDAVIEFARKGATADTLRDW